MIINGVLIEQDNYYLWSGSIDSMNGIYWNNTKCYIENINNDRVTIVDRNKNTWTKKQLIVNNIEFKIIK